MSLPRYEEYRDVRGIELGVLPNHWVVTRFSRIMGALKDGTHGTFQRCAEGMPLLSAKNVLDGYLQYGDAESLISEKDHAEIVANGFPIKGDILLTIVGTIGRSCVYDLNFSMAFQRSVCFIRLVSGLSPRFFYYQTQSKFFQEQLLVRSKSSAQAGVYMGDVAATSVVFPPDIVEQTAIADFLDRETAKIDALIAEQEKLIALLAEKRQATISRAVTRGLDPNVPLKDSGVPWLGKVPAHWEVVPLKYLVTLRSGGTPSKENLEYWNGEVPWASAKDMKLEELYDTEDHITEKALETGAACTVPAGSVLVVVRGMILARLFPVCQVMTPMAINQDLKAVLPGERLSADFLPWLLRGSAQESLRRLDEAGHGTKALRMDAWTSMQLPVPPLAEQRVIAEKLRHKLKLLAALSEEAVNSVNILKERRAALISAAVTGKIDVRGLAA